MKILALTDIHGRVGAMKPLTDLIQTADLIILCGDITHFGRKREINDIIDTLQKINGNIIAVSGNCDYPEVGQYLSKKEMLLYDVAKTINKICFYGLSGSLPCPGRTPNEYTEEECESILSGFSLSSNQPFILVSHQPPDNTINDAVTANHHVGCKAVRKFIEKTEPLICFTGHIHEGIGIDYIGKTAIVNPGPAFTGGYALAEVKDHQISNVSVYNIHGN